VLVLLVFVNTALLEAGVEVRKKYLILIAVGDILFINGKTFPC
jgi:hypothetical protein